MLGEVDFEERISEGIHEENLAGTKLDITKCSHPTLQKCKNKRNLFNCINIKEIDKMIEGL